MGVKINLLSRNVGKRANKIEGNAANLFSCKAVKILIPSWGKIGFYVAYIYIV